MQNKSHQSHALTPDHMDDPCDDWLPIGRAMHRVIESGEPHEDDASDDDLLFVRTFVRFGGTT